jgi:hypothetical protein
MPHSEMNITQKSRDENNDNKKRNNDTTINEKTTMLEVSQALIRPIKRDCFKYKYHLIFSSLIIIFFVVIILNITQIKIFFKEKNLEHNVVRNFSEIDSEPNLPTPMAGSESPIYWKNEKKINIQKVKREINSYIKDPEPLFDNQEDFIKRENPKISLIIPVYNKETFLHPLYKSIQSQSMKDIEIIFIDDNSNDDSVKIIEDFMRDDMRIILKKHDKITCLLCGYMKGKLILSEYDFLFFLENAHCLSTSMTGCHYYG